MVLDKSTYQALERVVGEKNISADPVITQCYAFNWCNELINLREGNEPDMFVRPPLAVVLPGSTKEIQDVVKIIHESGLKFKPQATGLGPWNCVSSDDVVIL
ncbi:MAG: hypothetical protein ACXQS8_05445, partial [Candidatus Helarchaeales archaeon]